MTSEEKDTQSGVREQLLHPKHLLLQDLIREFCYLQDLPQRTPTPLHGDH